MSKDGDTKFTTPPVVFVLEEQIEKLEAENKKLKEKNDLIWEQNQEIGGNYWNKVQENKILYECVEVMLENANCLWDKHPVRTEKESIEYVEKCLKKIAKEYGVTKREKK